MVKCKKTCTLLIPKTMYNKKVDSPEKMKSLAVLSPVVGG